ncbi:MAG: DUF4402 domain-containing protein [Gammaproteobacteria bacterium]|nr:DUF4402 domain-containing protein [Gammaproteobacteria bacterium]
MISLLSLLLSSAAYAAAGGVPGAPPGAGGGKPPPTATQCKNGWTLTPVATGPALNFGAFSIEAGTGSLTMNSGAVVSPAGQIVISSTVVPTTLSVQLTNTNTACAVVSSIINVSPAVATLTSGAATMPLSMVMTDSESQFIGTTLPVTITPAALPITFTFHGVLNTAFPQTSGAYTLAHSVDVTPTGAANLSVASTATATSLAPMGISETIAMDFGTVAGSSTASTVILDTLGGRTVTAGAQIMAAGPGTAGNFQITGEPNLTYTLLITGPAVLMNAGGQQITVTTFTNNSTGAVPATGIELFQVGATLHLGPLQAAGTYSTTLGGTPYTVTVNYN